MKWMLIFGVLLAGVAAYFFFFAPPNLAGEGRYILITSEISPSGTYTADTYVYGGGATVSNFSFVSVRPSSVPSKPDDFERRAVVMQRERRFELKWKDDHHLLIGHEIGDLTKKKEAIDNITVSFEEIEVQVRGE